MGLRELRLKRGLTQQQLGEKVGMSQGNLGDYETGRRPIENMTLGMSLRLCDALRVSNPRKLLDDSPKS
ncbi:helix-turn-helix transcriptional regulator [Bifidobacterium sp. LC6]|uniref:Helix-turn-helix transcriptional regulator n=1 Tax=Bifidobacterium colobi TaxID=2809026 RepID=A0ABS5UVR8_9BIFI|nr:helix-turn-helix transcriptional regulator [Bifidobacterium colobi]MBT1175182.1 helix-turn-helix transcriptional regulator [Bifidobacterium colobi]